MGEPSACRAWLELVRPPNLFTAPGDPLAGLCCAAALAGGAFDAQTAALAATAALLLYTGGLIGNDVADIEEDRHDRPGRPLPSGRVSRTAAFAASALCAGLGLLAALAAGPAAFVAACLTQAAVMLYNGGLKRRTIPGALAMGACRGLSFLIGAAAALPSQAAVPLAAAACLTVYVAGITWIADRETNVVRIGGRRWVPAAALVVLAAIVTARTGAAGWVCLLTMGAAAGWAVRQGVRLAGVPSPPVLGSAIGGLIRGLLAVQAAFATLAGTAGLAAAAVLLALWPASAAAARRFHAT